MPGDWWAVVYPDGTEEAGCEYGGGWGHWISGLTQKGAKVLRSVLGGHVRANGGGKFLLALGLGALGETALLAQEMGAAEAAE